MSARLGADREIFEYIFNAGYPLKVYAARPDILVAAAS
jgi:hypothetical protein